MTPTQQRIRELDYLKGLMTVLMISFHMVYIGESYPYAKQVVYTFHMPVFLLISGYVMNIGKSPRQFFHTIAWLTVPYILMESGYIAAASVLPIREHVGNLTLEVFFNKLFLHPIGSYWYLHTLILCGTVYYGVFRLGRLTLLSRYILMGLAFAVCARLGQMSLPMSFYFLAGAVVRHSGLTFLQVFRSSFLSWLAAGLLVVCPDNLRRTTCASVFIVYLVVSGCLAVYPHLGRNLRRMVLYLGRNTLPLFLFSPIFTLLCKPLVAILAFDPTGMLFLVCSLFVCILGSLAVKRAMDVCGLSPFFFGKRR